MQQKDVFLTFFLQIPSGQESSYVRLVFALVHITGTYTCKPFDMQCRTDQNERGMIDAAENGSVLESGNDRLSDFKV